jgi:hypothetical protein
MGSVGDCFDNAMCESFFATLECELLDRTTFRTQAEARLAVFDFIEGWYNPQRRHGAFLRFSDTEWGALLEALAREHPVASRRPSVAEWIRDLIVAHAGEVLEVDVTRSALQHQRGGAPDWKRWRLARAVRRAAARRRRRG